MTDARTAEQDDERYRTQADESCRHGLDSKTIVDEDACDEPGAVKVIAERDHPHTGTAEKDQDPANARVPPQPKHVWIFVLVVTIFGILLSWWGISFN